MLLQTGPGGAPAQEEFVQKLNLENVKREKKREVMKLNIQIHIVENI